MWLQEGRAGSGETDQDTGPCRMLGGPVTPVLSVPALSGWAQPLCVWWAGLAELLNSGCGSCHILGRAGGTNKGGGVNPAQDRPTGKMPPTWPLFTSDIQPL